MFHSLQLLDQAFCSLILRYQQLWRPGFDYLHTLFVFATFDFWLPWAHYSEEMSARLYPNRMDKTEIRHCNSLVFESVNVNDIY